MNLKKRAFVEYTGKFPHHSPHGNSKHNRNVYIRTSEKTMESVKDKVLFATGRKLYDALQTDNNNLLDKPRDLRLIYNAKSNQAKKKNSMTYTPSRDLHMAKLMETKYYKLLIWHKRTNSFRE